VLNNTNKIKGIYKEIEKRIFYTVPGKWDELYLYASIIDRFGKVQTGEMYFYFMPKGIFKRKFINVYEVPSKYDIEETEYMKLVELLYDEIKLLRDEFAKTKQKIWSNITISIKNSRFKIEYNYDDLLGGEEAYYNHHIYWRKKYLNIEPHSKKEKKALEEYLTNRQISRKKDEEYDAGIYQKRHTNIIAYETTDFKETQKVGYIATNEETQKIKNQILCNK